ncbi:putative pentatricopeptide repeat-containing protein At3g01580 isoform X2 [Mangifera indica]|uniref:putative pentatricopeptide repeat-containing protein At3g01580 isoform X2 n=1 Tax=Mangifera indica TaxID=29780 RepID=UPI001CF95ED0|nr:putative pentatricopeptide repeat-containing protein At3g01580 isoform X2 [Mangifera indica]
METGLLLARREVFVSLFKLCHNAKSLVQLHSQILKTGFAYHSFFATKLNFLYANFYSVDCARKVFDETPQKTVYLYNATLRSYCRANRWEDTLYLFNNMIFGSREEPDNFTIPIVLKACTGLRALKHGKMVHGFVLKNANSAVDMFVGSGLIELYSKCGQMGCALNVFKGFSEPDTVLWTSMVTGYEQNGFPEKAVMFFHRMVIAENVNPDRVTLVSLISACAQLMSFKLGGCVHGFVIRQGFDVSDLSLCNSLLNLYAKMGSTRNAFNLFLKMPEKDVISWSSMISCFAQNGNAVEALKLFNDMIDERFEPNAVTVVSALQACAASCNLEEGKKIHELAAEKGGYALNGMAYKSMEVFRDMLSDDTEPDAIAMVKILASCSELGVLQQAFCLHGYVVRKGFDSNIFIRASLIELYSKCGSLANAIKIFEGISYKDVVIWSAMIAGYGLHGQGREALKVFHQMVRSPVVRPNSVTFLSILSACSHAGLVEEGIGILDMMLHEYRLDLNSEHYGIIVDLLGRWGELSKALDIINQMPIPAGAHVWGALLGACRIHHNVKIGEVAAKNLFHMDPKHTGYYILLSNIYALDERWGSVAKLRAEIKEKGLKKTFGHSVVEVKNEAHKFVSDDRFHPEGKQIYKLLRWLEVKMREEGYAPDSELLYPDAEKVL